MFSKQFQGTLLEAAYRPFFQSPVLGLCKVTVVRNQHKLQNLLSDMLG